MEQLDVCEIWSVLMWCIRGVTHKNDVLLFCQRRLQQLRNVNEHHPDREGMELVWKYLELLIKQNGVSYLLHPDSLC